MGAQSPPDALVLALAGPALYTKCAFEALALNLLLNLTFLNTSTELRPVRARSPKQGHGWGYTIALASAPCVGGARLSRLKCLNVA